jgi:hypothetical protein
MRVRSGDRSCFVDLPAKDEVFATNIRLTRWAYVFARLQISGNVQGRSSSDVSRRDFTRMDNLPPPVERQRRNLTNR